MPRPGIQSWVPDLAAGDDVSRGWKKGPWQALRPGKWTAAPTAPQTGSPARAAEARAKEYFSNHKSNLVDILVFRTAPEAPLSKRYD
ncbi:hypothetical protein NDU88_001466 [Pleurodeles waltl]|uniref:Uncharacterized protein n=1 Tax=Pleurodeles waltl TaxID=8319 RepID=A0AAV7VBJ2_PLEWA|nr:hypothetical protein NDU88_001466 [Pleurodeles waltl]